MTRKAIHSALALALLTTGLALGGCHDERPGRGGHAPREEGQGGGQGHDRHDH